MTLWDMLDKTKYYQQVWIFETNAYDQNMPLFKGTVQDARRDTDRVWDYLMCEVDTYDCEGGLLDIRVRDKYYDERLEGHYSIASDSWGDTIETRPWRFSIEIEMEKRGLKMIDRDAFRAENGLNAKCEHCPTNTYECQRDMIHTKMEFCGMLDDAPVIVPAEGGTEK